VYPRRSKGLLGRLIFVAFFCAAMRSDISLAQDWRANWEQILAAARKEGRVVVIGSPGLTVREALVLGFKKSYPGIEVEYTALLPRQVIPRITQERRSGLYLWDAIVGGPSSQIVSLRPMDALAELRPALIIPDVFDDSKWREGFDSGFADLGKKFTYAFNDHATPAIFINRNFVSKAEFDSPTDMLSPKVAGRIAWDDPRVEGSGLNVALIFYLGYGEEFLKKLFAQQKILFNRDRRQLAEWVVKGRFPIALGVSKTDYEAFQEKGLWKDIAPLEEAKWVVQGYGPGVGAVSLIDRAPNPNAAKVYLNWLLSRDGQQHWNRATGTNSRRLDVVPGDPDALPKPGLKYVRTQTEHTLDRREYVKKLAEEHIPR
jgi:iron(III) transport system substrate-binding protein